MPIYQYRCTACRHEKEILHGMNQTITEVCFKCGEALGRLISASRVRFSGQGYYETDEKPKAKQRNVVREDKAPSSSTSD
jgi:putative FmdB family regulatory protein